MPWLWWQDLLLGIAAGLLLAWAALIVALLIARPRGGLLREALRLLPRLAGDRSLPRGVRVRLALLLAYLASPIDLVPDFIPVIGYADDAVIITAVLRSVVRHAGIQAIERHWPGTPDGLAALCRLTGLNRSTASPAEPPGGKDLSPTTPGKVTGPIAGYIKKEPTLLPGRWQLRADCMQVVWRPISLFHAAM